MRTLKDVLGIGENQYRFSVVGSLLFYIKVNADDAVSLMLKNAICAADAKFPWHDNYSNKPNYQSIGFLYETQRYNRGDVRCVEFRIVAKHEMMKISQVYAYEKYLGKLAEEVVKSLSEVSEAQSRIKVDSEALHFYKKG